MLVKTHINTVFWTFITSDRDTLFTISRHFVTWQLKWHTAGAETIRNSSCEKNDLIKKRKHGLF